MYVNINKIRLKTFIKLGVLNIANVAHYRLCKKIRYYQYRFPVGQSIRGPIFCKVPASKDDRLYIDFFSYHKIAVSSPPDWFFNPWTGTHYKTSNLHWSTIPDFIPELGDIKAVWELSRFDWLPKMAWQYKNGDKEALDIIECWLRDWCKSNPPNAGINWKCGQEAALRCLNLLTASLCIKESFFKPLPGFLKLLEIHLKRIIPTIRYAISQDNNHGISEAAALYTAGAYLAKFHTDKQRKAEANRWALIGKSWLEDRLKKLIMSDGSFSQHSVTYHRMVLDELSFVELFRQKMQLQRFSSCFYKKAAKATIWFHCMIDTSSGDTPNLGANDGAFLFNLSQTSYRDFFPSLQLAAMIFLQKKCDYSNSIHPLIELFHFNNFDSLSPLEQPSSVLMSHGGYACIRHQNGFAMLRLPIYKFRPSHADALHLDIWHNGTNWTRDSGTYSYNCKEKLLDYFPSTSAHSTVEFDGRDQMPRLGRFLYGSWLKPEYIEWKNNFVSSSYTDYLGAWHKRSVLWNSGRWIINDEISGFKHNAVLRWHLPARKWRLSKNFLKCQEATLKIESSSDMEIRLIKMPESQYYMQKQYRPVLEVHCSKPCKLTSIITFTY